ncbi:hypothetical protein JCM3774_005381 [Rhodotorula dairenensis]
MTSSQSHELGEAEAAEHPSPALLPPASSNTSSPSSTPTEAWSDDEIVAPLGPSEHAEDDDFDLVSSRDLHPAPSSRTAPVSSRNDLLLAAVASSQSQITEPRTTASPLLEASDAELVVLDVDRDRRHDQDQTDTESWRSSAASDSASADDKSYSASESGQSQDGGDGDDSSQGEGATGPMRLSFPDPIAASLTGHAEVIGASDARLAGVFTLAASNDEDEEIDRVQPPSGLGAEYSMLLDASGGEHQPGKDVEPERVMVSAPSSSSSAAASSVPASPLSATSRQLSEMSISPNKLGADSTSSFSSSALSASSASGSLHQPVAQTAGTTSSPDLTTSTPPRQPAPGWQPPSGPAQHRRRSSSPTPLPRGALVAALRQSGLPHDESDAAQSYHPTHSREQHDHSHVHEWIRTAAVGVPSSEGAREDREADSTATEPFEPVPRTAGGPEDPAVKEEGHVPQDGQEASQNDGHDGLGPREEPVLATSVTTPAVRSMASSAATVVPGRPNLVPGAEQVSASAHSLSSTLHGSIGTGTGLAADDGHAQGDRSDHDEDDDHESVAEADSSMRAYAHAPGTARSRRAVTILSFVAAAVAIAASGWLDSDPAASQLGVDSAVPASTTISAAPSHVTALSTSTEVLTLSETIKALIMETVAGPEAGSTLTTAMPVACADDSNAAAAVTESFPDSGQAAPVETPVQAQQDQAPDPPCHLLQQSHSVFAPRARSKVLEEYDGSLSGQILHRRGQRRLRSPRRRCRRREVLSLFDRTASPAVQAPTGPVLHMPPPEPKMVKPQSARQDPVPVGLDNAHSTQLAPKHEASWLSSWLQPLTADLVARVSNQVFDSGLGHGRHALVSANRGRRKLARRLEKDVAGLARDLQRQRDRVHDFAAHHRSTCKRSPHLPECFFERLSRRGQRDVGAWRKSIRSQVGQRLAAPYSWLAVVEQTRRKVNSRAFKPAYAAINPFLARQLDTLRRGTRRAQPLAYRGGEETVRQARKALQALKNVQKRFDGWRRHTGHREEGRPCRSQPPPCRG